MIRSKCVRHGLSKRCKSSAVGIAGAALLFGPALAGPPNNDVSDANGNTAGGSFALQQLTTGQYNTGWGQGTLNEDQKGSYNTAVGLNALIKNKNDDNTAVGFLALGKNEAGTDNTASGALALYNNLADHNTATGMQALLSNTTGHENTASGVDALAFNIDGFQNTASGFQALLNNTSGGNNTADGAYALALNLTGDFNTAVGEEALFLNNLGGDNTAVGYRALYNNVSSCGDVTCGTNNTALGFFAGGENTTGSGNTFIGVGAGANAGDYVNGTALGIGATLTASNSIVLGDTRISRIYANVTTITGISDRRRKKDIQALDADLGLDFIEKLQPVSYCFNNGDETERYGFVAQDLEGALPAALHDTIEKSEPQHGLALIERQNDEDRTYRVSYGELFAPMVKSIQQQQQEITEEHQQNADLRHALEALTGQFAALKAENEGLRHSLAALGERVVATQ